MGIRLSPKKRYVVIENGGAIHQIGNGDEVRNSLAAQVFKDGDMICEFYPVAVIAETRSYELKEFEAEKPEEPEPGRIT